MASDGLKCQLVGGVVGDDDGAARRLRWRKPVREDRDVRSSCSSPSSSSTSGALPSPIALVWSAALWLVRWLVTVVLAGAAASWAAFRRRFRRNGGAALVALGSLSPRTVAMRFPRHLAVALQNASSVEVTVGAAGDEAWMSDLANVVVWCVVVGIPFVTVYDVAGVVKKKADKFGERLLAAQKACLGKDFARYRIKSESPRIDYGYTNGMVVERWTRLRVAGPDDCKPNMVAAVRRLAVARGVSITPPPSTATAAATSTSVADSNARRRLTFLAEEFERQLGGPGCADPDDDDGGNGDVAPEPDMMITVGPVRTTAGFFPWHVRLTEIFRVPSLAALDEVGFAEVLRKFARCQQRFGT